MAERWQDLPMPDGSYSDDTRPWSQQDVVNYLPTLADQSGTQSRIKYKTVPGMAYFAAVGDGPHRGARDVEGRTFVVSGRHLYLVDADGSHTDLGVIPGTGRVSMTHNQIANGNELVIATGDNSYVYNTVTNTLTATGVPLVCVDFLNQLILGVDQARRFWRYSALADGLTWDPLDNESAESSPDRIVGGIVSNGEWYVFGERTIEVFSNSPTDFTAFQRTQVIEKGCASAATIQRLAGEIFFVGDDSVVYRLSGYSPIPISPKPITKLFAKSKPARLYANTWEEAGYVVYYLTARDGYTFGFDVTCQKWHRRESFGLKRWRINTLFKSNGAWYAGDALDNRLYRLDWRTIYEGCEIMPRGMRTGVLHSAGNRVTVHGLRLSVATGQDAQGVTRVEGPTITGSAPDGYLGEAYTYTYTTTPGDAPIVGTTIDEAALLDGLSWNQATATISGTPTEAGTMAITPRVTDANGLWDEISDEVNMVAWPLGLDPITWDGATTTGGPLTVGDSGISARAESNTVGYITADISLSEGDWYWETNTAWQDDYGSGINHYCNAGIIRSSDAATGLVMWQTTASGAGIVASSETLFTSQELDPNWILPPDELSYAIVRHRLAFGESGASWSIALDDGPWIPAMTDQLGSFSPHAASRGSSLSMNRVFIWSRPEDFTYAVPFGAAPLAVALL